MICYERIISGIIFALGAILLCFLLIWAAIINALWVNPRVLEIVEQTPHSDWVVAGIVFLAGASTLLGESGVLFINCVRRGRFIISLITNGIVFLISYAMWGALSDRAHSVLDSPIHR